MRSWPGGAMLLVLSGWLLPCRLTAGQDTLEATALGQPLSVWARQLRSLNVAERREAAQAFFHCRTEASWVVPVLVVALTDTDAEVRGHAALSIGAIGKPAAV